MSIVYVQHWDYIISRHSGDLFTISHHVTSRDGGYGTEVELTYRIGDFTRNNIEQLYDTIASKQATFMPDYPKSSKEKEIEALIHEMEELGLFPGESPALSALKTKMPPSVYTPEQVAYIAEQEDLSMLICTIEKNGHGFIFDHRHHTGSTVLRAVGSGFWYVYYDTGSKAKAENFDYFDNWQEACDKALEYALADKTERIDSDSKITPQILRWSLDAEGTLTLSGKGPMLSPLLPIHRIIDADQMAFELEYGDWMLKDGDVELEFTLPWDGTKVRKVIIEPGLTTVATASFSSFSYILNNCRFNGTYQLLEEIILPDTVESLKGNSIRNCPVLKKVVIPPSVCDICEDKFSTVFSNCPCVRIYTPAGSYAEAFAQRNGIIAVNPSSTGKYTAPVDALPLNYRDPSAMPRIIPAVPNSNCLRSEITKTPVQNNIFGPVYHLLFTGADGTAFDLTVQEQSYAISRSCSLCQVSSSKRLAFLMEEAEKLLEKSYGVSDSKVKFEPSLSGGPGITIRTFRLKEFSFGLWFFHDRNGITLQYEFKRNDNPFPDQLSAYLAERLTELDSAFQECAPAPAKTVSTPQSKEMYLDCQRFAYTSKRSYNMPSEKEIYPLVAISDYLISQGFTFCRASAGGGTSEISHTGDAPYYVVYQDLGCFRNNFVEDFFACQKKEKESSDGWISSLNYSYVDVYLKKGPLLFHARVGGGTDIAWYGYTEKDQAIIEQADEAMQRILGNCTHVERQVQPQAKVVPSYWN